MTVEGKTEKKWPVYCDSKRIMLGDGIKIRDVVGTVAAINLLDVGESLVIVKTCSCDCKAFSAFECALLASKVCEAYYYDGRKVAVGEWYVDPRELGAGHSPVLHCTSSEKINGELNGRTDLLPERLFVLGDGGYVKTGETYFGGDNTRWKVLGYNATEKQGHIVRVESVADPEKKRDVKAKWLEHGFHNMFADICRDMKMDSMTYCINFGLCTADPTDSMLWHVKDRMRRCRDGQ